MASSGFKICWLVTTLLLVSSLERACAQEQDFVNLVQNLLQGDELKTFQQTYAALPLEVRDKLTKNLLNNPGQLGQDLLGFLGPQVGKLLGNLQGNAPQDNENEVDVESMDLKYSKDGKPKVNRPNASGFDWSSVGSLLGTFMNNNPEMLVQMASGFLQNNGQGFSFEAIAGLVTKGLDMDTVLNLAQSFGLGGQPSEPNRQRGEGDVKKASGGIAEMLKIGEIMNTWNTFASSPMGQKFSRVLPRLLKSGSLPDALRILEKETSFRFDIVLRQLQDPTIRPVLVSQTVKPIGQFVKSISIPDDIKSFVVKADDILHNKLGLGVQAKEFIEPVLVYIRDTFRITHDSLLDLKAEDIERIAADVLNKEVLDPLNAVWSAHEKSRKNSACAEFIYCQLNHNYHNENFIRRNVIKSSSIISAFQMSNHMKKDAFSKLYEAVYKGADGYDCTHGVNKRCLDLMNTPAHSEL